MTERYNKNQSYIVRKKRRKRRVFMELKDVMTHDLEVVQARATVKEAADKMRNQDVGFLPVCDGSDVVGILTDRDITLRASARGLDPEKTQVSQIMTTNAIHCFEDQKIEDVANIMRDNQVRRLIVLDRSKMVRGVVSLGDLAARTRDRRTAGETLEKVSE